jgi:hypothetical protein
MSAHAQEGRAMADDRRGGGGRRGNRWRALGWSFAGLLLLTPLVAMQFTDEVNWGPLDFVFAAILLGGVGVAFELAVRKSGNVAYRVAVGLALVAMFLLVWINAAVGIIGSEDNDANMMYLGVLAIGIIGALIARFRPLGMARTLFGMALAQAAVAAIAIVLGLDDDGINSSLELALLNGFFIVLFVGSAALFLRAAQGRADPGTV